MIPLYVFLLIWLALLAVFAFVAMLSVIQMLRFGIAGAGTYLSTTLFLAISFIVIFGTSTYVLNADWQQSVDLFSGLRLLPIFNP